MTQPLTPTIEGPPLPGGVRPGDVIWVPTFACAERNGAPFWLRVTAAGPSVDGIQEVTGVRVVSHGVAHAQPESERVVTVEVPLNRTCRRVFEATP